MAPKINYTGSSKVIKRLCQIVNDAESYIRRLPSATAISDTDVLAIDDGQHNRKITWSSLKALLRTVTSIEADEEGQITLTLADGQTVSCTPHDSTKQDKLTFDTTPTTGSVNPVTSDGIRAALDELQQTIDDLNERVGNTQEPN